MPEKTNWRLIELETHSAAQNMALDEACLEGIAAQKSPSTIRFYRWNPSAVSIGYFQSLEQEVYAETCRQKGIEIVRRQTGGGAVYHDFAGEITYSLLAPASLFPSSIGESYQIICQSLINGLSLLGLEARFAPINDVTVNGQKISGNAQTRRKGVLLQHGTILFDVDVDTMFDVLNVSKEKIKDKFIQSVYKRVTSIRREREVSFEQAYAAIRQGFTHDKNVSPGTWSAFELARSQELATQKYASDKWTHLR